jgi:riboflavin biosynthesis pyrimidine reductase
VLRVQGDDDRPAHLLATLADNGLTRLLVEGGMRLAGVFERAGCVDELVLFRGGAPLAGGRGKPLADIVSADLVARVTAADVRRLGPDTVQRADVSGDALASAVPERGHG